MKARRAATAGFASERLLVILNGLILLLLVGFLFRPGGSGYETVAGWGRERRLQRTISREWDALVAGTSRVDSGGREVLLVEFADYQCPFCAQSASELEAFLVDHPHVGVLYRHFPLRSIHPAAEGAARAAICAEAQGTFRQMHRRLFESSQWHSQRNWVAEASSAGVPNLSAFEACLNSPSTTARLAADEALAARLDVRGTPTFFTLSRARTGAMSRDDVRAFLGRRVVAGTSVSVTEQ